MLGKWCVECRVWGLAAGGGVGVSVWVWAMGVTECVMMGAVCDSLCLVGCWCAGVSVLVALAPWLLWCWGKGEVDVLGCVVGHVLWVWEAGWGAVGDVVCRCCVAVVWVGGGVWWWWWWVVVGGWLCVLQCGVGVCAMCVM